MRYSRYTWLWLLLVATLLAAVALFNAVLDPYLVLNSPRIAGMNAKKPKVSGYTALTKTYQIDRSAPVTLLMGTSRVDIGLDPDHSEWPSSAKPVYNYGLPGASILNMKALLEHATAAGSVRQIFIGLEFQDFLRAQIPPAQAPDESVRRVQALHAVAGVQSWPRLRQRAADLGVSTLTLGALIDSGSTLLAQYKAHTGDVSDRGLTSEAPYLDLVRKEGHHDLFAQKSRSNARALIAEARELKDLGADRFVELVALQQILDLCKAKQIQVTLFIPPYHAHHLELLAASGLWSRFEAWKVALTDLVALNQTTSDPKLLLWDFATHDEYATEAVPMRGDRNTGMQWFWESVHFKKAMGDLMLARMLGMTTPGPGNLLTPAVIQAHLKLGQQRQRAYRQTHAGDSASIAALVGTVK